VHRTFWTTQHWQLLAELDCLQIYTKLLCMKIRVMESALPTMHNYIQKHRAFHCLYTTYSYVYLNQPLIVPGTAGSGQLTLIQ